MFDITIITGFWTVNTNRKKDLSHYKKNIPDAIKSYKYCNVIFYYNDEEILNIVKKSILPQTKICFKKIEIHDLPTWHTAWIYTQKCRWQNLEKLSKLVNGKPKLFFERGYYNKRNLLQLKSNTYTLKGELNFQQLFTIWTSKFYLIEEAIKDNKFNTKNFAWNDSVWNSNFILNFMNETQKNKIIHCYNKNFTCKNQRILMCAGRLVGNKKTFLKYINLFKTILEEYKDDDYGHDEETLLQQCYNKDKTLFAIKDILCWDIPPDGY